MYVVMFIATVNVWLQECRTLFLCHETRSLVFPEQVLDGYLATRFCIALTVVVRTTCCHSARRVMTKVTRLLDLVSVAREQAVPAHFMFSSHASVAN